jgi:hypothetical protein
MRLADFRRSDRNNPMRASNTVSLSFLAALALLLAGCAGTPLPPRPAMIAFDTVAGYGHRATQTADGSYEVHYLTPALRVSLDAFERQAQTEVESQKAHDFALWRAAELAQQEGYPWFRLTGQSTDTQIDIQVEHYDRPVSIFAPWGPLRFGTGGGWHNNRYRPFGYYGYADPFYYERVEHRRAILRVDASLEVVFEAEEVEGAFSVADTIAALSKSYAGAVYPAR